MHNESAVCTKMSPAGVVTEYFEPRCRLCLVQQVVICRIGGLSSKYIARSTVYRLVISLLNAFESP
jgi:hypothetical protein